MTRNVQGVHTKVNKIFAKVKGFNSDLTVSTKRSNKNFQGEKRYITIYSRVH